MNKNWFKKWFLNNRFSIFLLNTVLFLIALFVYTKVAFILNPVWMFIGAILPPIILALMQFYLMEPIVDFFQNKCKVPRVITILILFCLVGWLIVWIINGLVPLLQSQINQLLKNWPTIWSEATTAVKHWLHDPRLLTVKSNLQNILDQVQKNLFKSLQGTITGTLSNLQTAVNLISEIAMTLLTAPFILFFLLKDGKKMSPYLVKFAPESWQESLKQLLHEINFAVASYVRGQLIVAFLVGVMFTIGYSVIDLPYGTALAVIAGFMNLIPYFGTFIAFIPALVIGLIVGMPTFIKVLIVFAIEQTVESRFISPIIVGNKMNMHPVTTIIVLIGAGASFGIWGVLFAIPGYSILKILCTKAFNYYQNVSSVYGDERKEEND
ncbi:MAG: AI-2E family transporter [Lactobacillus sp.]|nr:AI-2E family transporter [Lactobacillus sp.]